MFGSDVIQVGKEDTIEVTVQAKYLMATRTLRGDILAQENIEWFAPAKVEGSIESPVFCLRREYWSMGRYKWNPRIQLLSNHHTFLSLLKNLNPCADPELRKGEFSTACEIRCILTLLIINHRLPLVYLTLEDRGVALLLLGTIEPPRYE